MNKPSIPKGTRDFGPIEMQRRNYIFQTISKVFQLHGFQQIETPSMENLSTLMGKYGEEGDRLLFKILNSGDFLKGINYEDFNNKSLPRIANSLCEKGLRYDLTVPFARYVVQHRNDITFPFKRFQIQPVWRADRPQKGRYREFYQCDSDIIGSDSLLCEVELINIIDSVFYKLKINNAIHINNRKILAGIAEVVGLPNHLIDLTVAMDKLDKIGLEGVLKELYEKGFSEDSIQSLLPFIKLSGSNSEKTQKLEELLSSSEIGKKGLEELTFILNALPSKDLNSDIIFNPSLARGLGYYTGTILEVKSTDVAIGSITGGGRYDNLTGIFGLSGVSGVGISFGADRIYDVLEQTNNFPDKTNTLTQILFINFGKKEALFLLPTLKKIREMGIPCELYPDDVKLKKQMSYADTLSIPFVILAGSDEIEKGLFTLKNMNSGEQFTLTERELIDKLKSL